MKILFVAFYGMLIFIQPCFSLGTNGDSKIILKTKFRQKNPQNPQTWLVINDTVLWDPNQTAIIICDMWDKHHDLFKAKNVDMMAVKMNQVIIKAREKGITIIHSPSEVMKYYKDFKQRKRLINAAYKKAPKVLTKWNKYEDWELSYYSHMEQGISETANNGDLWTRQNKNLEIYPEDGISDDGQEIYNYFHQKNITNIILMGVHTNWCILGRPFGLRQWKYLNQFNKRWNVVLMRDLTETGVGVGDNVTIDGVSGNFMSHDRSTDKIVEHIERFWAPTIHSRDLLPENPKSSQLIIKNDFDDGELFYDSKGFEDFELGGGFYNLSLGHDWKSVGGASSESKAVQESKGIISLQSTTKSDIAAIVTRICFDTDNFKFPFEINLEWKIQKIINLSKGNFKINLGLIDADGPLGTPHPNPLTTKQIYLTLKNELETGFIRGELGYTHNGRNHVIKNSKFLFSQWKGVSPLTLNLSIKAKVLKLSFDKPIKKILSNSLEVSLPLEILNVEAFNAFATVQSDLGNKVEFDRLIIRKK